MSKICTRDGLSKTPGSPYGALDALRPIMLKSNVWKVWNQCWEGGGGNVICVAKEKVMFVLSVISSAISESENSGIILLHFHNLDARFSCKFVIFLIVVQFHN